MTLTRQTSGWRLTTASTLREFCGLEAAWRAAHAADPHANVFTSWAWLRGWAEGTDKRWRALALQDPNGNRVAFLMLEERPGQARSRVNPLSGQPTLRLAGHPVGNHMGLVCPPHLEDRAVEEFGRYLHALPWRALDFGLVSDPRIERLCRLVGREADLRAEPDEPSPRIELPGSYDEYLATRLDGRARRELRRRGRKAADAGIRLATAGQADLELHLNALLHLHEARFGPLPGRYLRLYRTLFGRCAEAGLLHLQVLWQGERPVAAQVGFLDHDRLTYHGCQSGWDPAYAALSPGTLIKFEAIRHAIGLGFRTFDLGRGGQEHKELFGGGEYATRRFRLHRSPVRALLHRLAAD